MATRTKTFRFEFPKGLTLRQMESFVIVLSGQMPSGYRADLITGEPHEDEYFVVRRGGAISERALELVTMFKAGFGEGSK